MRVNLRLQHFPVLGRVASVLTLYCHLLFWRVD